MKIGINASDQLERASITELVDHAVTAERDGFASWWLAQVGLVDVLTVIAAAGPKTSTIEMGSAVLPTYIRHPQTAAAQALTTTGFVGDRLVLGIGASHKPAVEHQWGMRFVRPADQTEDYLRILTALLDHGYVSYEGDFWTANVELTRPAGTVAPSVMLAALGPIMLRLAAEYTDGTILWMVGPATIREHIAPTITRSAERFGRRDPMRIVCSLPIMVTDDEQDGRDFCSDVYELYGHLPSYRAMLDREGAAQPGDVCLVGTEDRVREQLAALDEAGTTDFAGAITARNAEEYARTRALLTSVIRDGL